MFRFQELEDNLYDGSRSRGRFVPVGPDPISWFAVERRNSINIVNNVIL